MPILLLILYVVAITMGSFFSYTTIQEEGSTSATALVVLGTAAFAVLLARDLALIASVTAFAVEDDEDDDAPIAPA